MTRAEVEKLITLPEGWYIINNPKSDRITISCPTSDMFLTPGWTWWDMRDKIIKQLNRKSNGKWNYINGRFVGAGEYRFELGYVE